MAPKQRPGESNEDYDDRTFDSSTPADFRDDLDDLEPEPIDHD